MLKPIVTIQNLYHVYLARTPLATPALQGASLRVYPGEIGALIGPSGAGKTTLVSFINGLLRPNEYDRVYIFDHDLADPKIDLAALRRRIGLVFQHPHHQLFERYVGDDIAYGPRQLGLAGEALRDRVRRAMEAVGLDFEAFKDRLTFTLSGGEMRRVAIAGVLAMEPELMVLDEATTGLDPEGKALVHDLLRRLRDQENMSILIVSNDMDEVATLADRVTVLVGGKTMAEGSPREIFYGPTLLESWGLSSPPIVRMAKRMQAEGLPLPENPLTVSEMEESLWQVLKA